MNPTRSARGQLLLDEMLDSACDHRHAYGPRAGLEFEKQRRVAGPDATLVRRSSDHQGIPHQQDLSRFDVAVVILRARSNSFDDLVPLGSPRGEGIYHPANGASWRRPLNQRLIAVCSEADLQHTTGAGLLLGTAVQAFMNLWLTWVNIIANRFENCRKPAAYRSASSQADQPTPEGR
jgi:hypothetical protein